MNTIHPRASVLANSRSNQRRRRRAGIIVACAIGPIVAALARSAPAAVRLSSVAAGSATVSQQGSITTIRTGTNNTILYFSKFDIAGGSTVNFIQPSAAGRVLDHVTSAMPSMINGTLMSNGAVYLINPAGVIFGAGAVVDVNRFYAAAANFSNQDFLSGVDHFTGVSGMVFNSGQIRANQVSLIGSQVMNAGNIIAPNGYVAMLAGSDVLVSEQGSHITARVASPAPIAGSPAASGAGAAAPDLRNSAMAAGDVYSLAIRHTGTIQASNVLINGGQGQVQVSGSINASTQTPGAVGGSVAITGGEVNLVSADINVSGPGGGGVVEIGGGPHGGGDLSHAQNISVDANSTVDADAISNGSGGTIVLWSEGMTIDSGTLTARGGAAGGNGGYIETSGDYLQVFAAPNASAPHGNAGTWVMDPINIDIQNGTGTGVFTGSVVFNADIDAALNGGTSVVVDTSNQTNGSDTGTLTQDSDAIISVTPTSDVTLTLRANDAMLLQGGITSSGSSTLSVELDQLNSGGSNVTINTNAININGTFTVVGGNVALSTGVTASSVSIGSGTVVADSGSIPVTLGTVASSAPIVTTAGSVGITTATSVTTTAGGTIAVTGGNVTISSSGAIAIGDAVNTGGGAFAATGTGFSNAASITDGGANASNNPFTVNTSTGTATTNIAGAISWTGSGGVDIEGGGGVGTTAAGTITSTGATLVPVSFYTTGVGSTVTIGGNVNTNGVFTASGGAFTLSATGGLTANSASINVAAATHLDSKAVTSSTVNINEPIVASAAAGPVLLGGTSVTTAATAGTMSTNDGAISLTPSGATSIGGAVTTTGGNFSVGGTGLTTTASIGTAGGNVAITSSGASSIGAGVTTGGGTFAAGGTGFTSTAAIGTAGGNVTITSTGADSIGAAVTTGAGKFSATGSSSFNNAVGGTITTANGEVDISSTGSITISGAITTGTAAGPGGGVFIDFGNSGSPVATGGGTILISAAIETGGGLFDAGGTGFENDATISILDTSSNAKFTVDTTAGAGSISINGAIAWGGTTGGIIIQGAGGVNVAAGALTETTAATTVPVSIFTTGTATPVNINGTVDTLGAFTASGGIFSLGTTLAPAGLTANSVSINLVTSTPAPDVKSVTVNAVNIFGPVNTTSTLGFQSGGTTFTSNLAGTITTAGGSVVLTTTVSGTTLGAAVNTGGGAFTVSGGGLSSFTNNAPISIGVASSSTFTVNTGGSININGAITWAGTGGVTITGANQITTTAAGTITSTGAAAMPVSLFTTVAAQGTGGQIGITLGSAVNTTGAFVASGGNFILSTGVTLTAASVSLNIPSTTPLTNPGTVTLEGPIVSNGGVSGFVEIGGTISLSDNSPITTNGGAVHIEAPGTIGLGGAIQTGGGTFTSDGVAAAGSSNFTTSDAPITTSGGDVVIKTTSTDGAEISSDSPVNTGGGNFTVTAMNFENDSAITDGGVATTGKSFTVATTSGTGVDTFNGTITWTGGTNRTVVIEGGGDVNVTSIVANGVTALPVSIFTTGSSNTVTINGAVTTTGAFVGSGANFNVGSGGSINAPSVQINNMTSASNNVPIVPGAASIAGTITTIGGDFTAAGTSFASSGGGVITTNGSNVVLLTTGTISIAAPVNTGGGAFTATHGNSFTTSTGGTITTVGGPVTITSNGSVALSTGQITIGDEINTGGGSFAATGVTFTATGEVTDGGVNAGQGLTITSTGGNVTVGTGGNINWAASLAPVAFVIPSGSNLALGGTITVNPAEPLNFDAVAVSLVGTATVAGGNISFGSIVNTNSNAAPSLTVESSGAVSFTEAVGSVSGPIGSLTVTTNGSAVEPVTTLSADIVAVGNVIFGGGVVLPVNVAITATDIASSSTQNNNIDHNLEFDGTIEGPGGLTLTLPNQNQVEQIRLNSNIGDQTPLAFLDLNSSGEGIIFFRGGVAGTTGSGQLGSLPGVTDQQPATVVDIASGGTFEVNDVIPGPKQISTLVASIGSYGPLSINIGSAGSPNAANTFAMGQYEKLSVFGALSINTNGGTARLGDLSAFGNLTLNAANVEFLLRQPTFEGSTALDEGVDVIANGEITMPASANYTAVSPTGPGAFGIPGFIGTSFNPSSNIASIAAQLKTAISIVSSIPASSMFFPSANLLLDLTPSTLSSRLPTFIPPIPFVFDLPIAGAVPRQQLVAGTVPPDFKDAFMPGYPGPSVQQDLKDYGVFTREPTLQEILDATDSIVDYNDTPRKRRPRAEDFSVAVSRLDSSRVQKFLDQYHDLFSARTSPDMPSRRAQMAADLQEAWDVYVSQNGNRRASGAGFQRYVAATPSALKVSADLVQLNSLFQQLNMLGLSHKEAQMFFQHNVLAGLPANGMQDGDLIAAVESAGNVK